MCEEAREIQQEHNIPTEGDWFVDGGLIEIFTERDSDDLGEIEYRRKYSLWLPRQDQLQEISGMNWVDFDSAIKQFGDSLFHNKYSSKKYKGSHLERSEEISKMVTREQLAIRVIMWENYEKIWDDKKQEWVRLFMKSIGNKEVL